MSRNLSPITGVSASVLVATDPARFAFISVVFALAWCHSTGNKQTAAVQGGRTPLHHAAVGNREDLVRMLLEFKAEVNTKDEVRIAHTCT